MTVKAVWHIVKESAKSIGVAKLAPHDLRRTCARLCHASGGELEQIQFLLGGTFRCRRPNATLAARTADSISRQWIALASSPLPEVGARSWKVGRHSRSHRVAARAKMPVAITSTGVFGCIWENATSR